MTALPPPTADQVRELRAANRQMMVAALRMAKVALSPDASIGIRIRAAEVVAETLESINQIEHYFGTADKEHHND